MAPAEPLTQGTHQANQRAVQNLMRAPGLHMSQAVLTSTTKILKTDTDCLQELATAVLQLHGWAVGKPPLASAAKCNETTIEMRTQPQGLKKNAKQNNQGTCTPLCTVARSQQLTYVD